MKVGIAGSGTVAQALGAGFAKHGHEVMLGTREPGKLQEFCSGNPGVRAGSFEEAARFGDLLVLATNGSAIDSAVGLMGAENLANKVLIDATNPVTQEGGAMRLFVDTTDSLGERVQKLVPQARVVKAFNMVGSHLMVDPKFPDGPPTMLIAGNDDGAKNDVTAILRDFGWDVADLGGIEASRYLEPLCLPWIAYGVKSGTWHHAFKLLR